MIAQTTAEYTEKEVAPNSARIEEKDYELQRQLLRKAGELGLLSASIPEQYGGLALDHISSMLISEYLTGQGFVRHDLRRDDQHRTSADRLFRHGGTEAKYLPKIGSGEWVSAYCLSESGSGSDALAARPPRDSTPKGRTGF